jgi:hypothetical protein
MSVTVPASPAVVKQHRVGNGGDTSVSNRLRTGWDDGYLQAV